MRHHLRYAAVLALAGAVAAPLLAQGQAAAPEPAAQLLNVKGSVEVRRAGEARPATLLMTLQPGDVVRVRPGGAAEVVLTGTGARFGLSSGSAAQVNASGLTRRSGAAPKALRKLALPNPPVRSFNRRMLGLGTRGARGPDPNAPAKGTPYGAVRDFPVVLKWTGSSPEELNVSVQDEKKTAVLETKVPGATRELAVPDANLEKGKFYVWTVKPAAGKAGSIGWFRVLLPQEKTSLEFLERQTGEERSTSPDNPSPILLLAQTYERFGMYDDAMNAYQSAAQMRPNDPGLQDAMKRLTF